MDEGVSIEGIDPAVLLVELLNATPPRGLGVFAAASAGGFGLEHAKRYFDGFKGDVVRFDYVAGRPIKVAFDLNARKVFRTWLYDRDAGEGAFLRAVERARAKTEKRVREVLP